MDESKNKQRQCKKNANCHDLHVFGQDKVPENMLQILTSQTKLAPSSKQLNKASYSEF